MIAEPRLPGLRRAARDRLLAASAPVNSPQPTTVNVQVDGETNASADHNAQRDSASRAFSPVPPTESTSLGLLKVCLVSTSSSGQAAAMDLRMLPDRRVRLLAALGYAPAIAFVSPPFPTLKVDRADDRPTWEIFSWWLGDLERIDPTAILAAGVVIGERLLPLCEPNAYDGDFARIIAKLRAAWESTTGAPIARDQLRDMAGRINSLNEAECALDSGGEMPTVRVASRAMTQLAQEFTESKPDGWLANAVEGLEIADRSLDRQAVDAALKAGIIQLVLTAGSGVPPQ